MIKNLKKRIENLEAQKGYIPRTYCTMQDGTKKTYWGVEVVTPFLNGEIVEVKTEDADIAALLNAFNEPIPVSILG